jgi:hypothetical protein
MPASARVAAPQDLAAELDLIADHLGPEPVKLVLVDPVAEAARPAALAELEAQRIARARISMARLYQAIASPHLARFSIPWQPEVYVRAGICEGCQQRIAADRVSGHAVTRAQAKRGRCVRWCFSIPEDQT